jgi:hypothetical protein
MNIGLPVLWEASRGTSSWATSTSPTLSVVFSVVTSAVTLSVGFSDTVTLSEDALLLELFVSF